LAAFTSSSHHFVPMRVLMGLALAVADDPGEATALLQPRRLISEERVELAVSDDDEWKLAYLKMVYGEDVSNAALFDEIDITYLYSNPQVLDSSVYDFSELGRNTYDQECQANGTTQHVESIQPPDVYLWRNTQAYLDRAHVGVADNTWLEVTRAFIGWTEGRRPDGVVGCWFMARKGSGVFVDTRKTLVVEDADDVTIAAAGLLSYNPETGEMHNNQWHYCDRVREMGYDSIQILNMNMDGGAHEFVHCGDECQETELVTACVPNLELRTGLHADKPCTCDFNIGLLNCGRPIAPSGETNVCNMSDESPTLFTKPRRVVLPAFHFQLQIDKLQGLVELFEPVALPGVALRWYPWRRLLAEQLVAAVAARGLTLSENREPAVEVADAEGRALHDLSHKELQAVRVVFPISLNVSVFAHTQRPRRLPYHKSEPFAKTAG